MNSIHPIKALFRSVFSMKSTALVSFRTYSPPDSPYRRVIEHLPGIVWPDIDLPLAEQLPTGRGAVIVFLCGHGNPHGPHFQDQKNPSVPIPVSPGWWNAPSHRLHFFAYFCESSAFLRDERVARLHSGALGFNSKLWFWLGNDSAIAFWREFLLRLHTLVSQLELLDEGAYLDVKHLYEQFIEAKARDLKTHSIEDGLHLNLLCLRHQLDSLEFIPGKGV